MGEIARGANGTSEAATKPTTLPGRPICGVPASVLLTVGGNPVELGRPTLLPFARRPNSLYLTKQQQSENDEGIADFGAVPQRRSSLAIGHFE